MGYPSKATLYRWNQHKEVGIKNYHGITDQHHNTVTTTHSCNSVKHPRHPSAATKINALNRCFEQGKDVEYVSRDIGYSSCSIYKWRRLYMEKGALPRGTIKRPLIFSFHLYLIDSLAFHKAQYWQALKSSPP